MKGNADDNFDLSGNSSEERKYKRYKSYFFG